MSKKKTATKATPIPGLRKEITPRQLEQFDKELEEALDKIDRARNVIAYAKAMKRSGTVSFSVIISSVMLALDSLIVRTR